MDCLPTNSKTAVESSEFLFICVGTPSLADDSPDLKYIMSVADGIAKYINGRKVVINKSTVPVGTADAVTARIAKDGAARPSTAPTLSF